MRNKRAKPKQPTHNGSARYGKLSIDRGDSSKSRKFQDIAKHEAENDATENRDRWAFYLTAFNAFIAVAVAVFTGLLVCVGWRGVHAAIRTLKAIEWQVDLQERSIRPWIGTESIADGSLAPDGTIQAQVILRNTGPSVCTGWHHASIFDSPFHC